MRASNCTIPAHSVSPKRPPPPYTTRLAPARIELHHPGAQRLGEALLLQLQDARNLRCLAREFRKRFAHRYHERRHELIEERLRLAEFVAVAHRAPDDTPQHIAAAFV